MKRFFKTILNFFNFKEKTNHMTIAELKAFKVYQVKIEKQKRFRAYISEINKRYNQMRIRESNSLGKVS
tara:strand:- start:807 stop:1013 length:207 start_codon:yes stop_codon:yes gene_type:complete